MNAKLSGVWLLKPFFPWKRTSVIELDASRAGLDDAFRRSVFQYHIADCPGRENAGRSACSTNPALYQSANVKIDPEPQ
jgi:hypothetical protein